MYSKIGFIKTFIIAALTFVVVCIAITNYEHSQDEKGYVSVNGLNIYYEMHGEGEPLILLHGAFGNAEGWAQIVPALKESRRVIAVEMEGHGRTNDLDRPLEIRQMSKDIAVLMEELNLHNADIFGYSLGGIVGLGIAIEYPELVRKLAILGSTSGRLDETYEPEQYLQYQSIPDDFAPPMLKEPYDRLSPNPERWYDMVIKIRDLGPRFEGFMVEELGSIQAEVLIMMGDRDVISPEHAVAMYRKIPHAQLVIYPGGDHFMLWSDPDKVMSTLITFLDAPIPGEARNLVINRTFNAPLEEVWKAWSESEYIKQWWGPHGFTAPVADINFREGNKSLVAMNHPDMGTFYNTWMYTKIEPMEQIEFISRFADENGRTLSPTEAGLPVPDGIPDEVRHVITFKSLGDNRTELTIEEYGYTTNQAMELSKMGMEQCLEKMAEIFVRSH